LTANTKRTLTAAIIVGGVSGVFETPSVLAQIVGAFPSMAVIFGILMAGWRLFRIANWSSEKQEGFGWGVALVIGVTLTWLH